MAYGGEAARLGRATALDQAFDGLIEHVVVDPRLVARLATQQGIDRHAEVFAGDVPQRDVDGAERAHDRRPAKVGGAIHVLPVVFDAQGILPDQVVREFGDDLLGSFEERPGTGFAQPDDAGIGVNFDKQIAIDRYGFDASDVHVG